MDCGLEDSKSVQLLYWSAVDCEFDSRYGIEFSMSVKDYLLGSALPG